MLSGGAPLTPTVHEFLTCVFGCTIVQGYGLTETCAGATAGYLEDSTFGHVGAPMPCCEIKLVSVDDMPEYDPNGSVPCGEIAIRGPNVSPGYFRDPEKTAEAFRNGWFYTGDIGRWNPDGTLSIIDRKKNIFKLSQGEYIAVEKLEGIYIKSRFVSQIWVYGDSTKAHLVAVVFPDSDSLIPWAREQGIGLSGNVHTDFKMLCMEPRAAKAVVQDLRQVAKASKLRGFEIVECVHLTAEEFTPSNNLVTPTFKLKRPQLKMHFHVEIEGMYDSISSTS
jgi:long-chain acyl-CoA synthetase